jgi:molecular chaperone GrpE
MQQVETADVPPNQVLSEVVRGYMLNDRLMRPALVSVSKPLPAVEGAAQQAPPAEGAGEQPASGTGGETGGSGVSKNESGS